MTIQPYITDDAEGEHWRLMLGDSCERLAEIEQDSVDLSVFSPPFSSLYTYSPSERDLGNSSDDVEFFEHYKFIVDELLRVTKPGRNCCVHVQQVTISKANAGYVGLKDFRGEVIRAHQAAGWIFYGEVTVDKNPQAQAIRTKAHCLMFQTLRRDSAANRPALADYLLVFKKPGRTRSRSRPTSRTRNGSTGRTRSGGASESRTPCSTSRLGTTRTSATSARCSSVSSSGACACGRTPANWCCPRSPASGRRATCPSGTAAGFSGAN